MTAKSERTGRRTAFVISPIGAAGSDDYTRFLLSLDYIVKKALPEDAWYVIRADFESSPDSITSKVVSRIIESELIVADLSDHNPNVFYELAVAHGYKRPVVHIMADGQRPPFDVVDQRVIFYDLTNPASVDKAVESLRDAALHAISDEYSAKTPLTEFRQYDEIRSGKTSEDTGPAVATALAELSHQVRVLSQRITVQESQSSLDTRILRGDTLTGRSLAFAIEEASLSYAALKDRYENLRNSPATSEDAMQETKNQLLKKRAHLRMLERRLQDIT